MSKSEIKQMFLDIIVGGGLYTLFWATIFSILIIAMMNDTGTNTYPVIFEGYANVFGKVKGLF